MTPIQFNIQLNHRELLPIVVYAAGLICELRPDLADQVREALLVVSTIPGDKTSAGHLRDASEWCAWAKDEQGANALSYLREIVHYGGNDSKALHGLADVLGLLPWSTAKYDGERWNNGTVWWRQSKEEPWSSVRWRPDDVVFEPPPVADTLFGHVPIGHAFWHQNGTLRVCGLLMARFQDQAEALRGSRVVWRYLHEGFVTVWGKASTPGACEALRRLIPLHAHTVSLDATVRTEWAKVHLDALDNKQPKSE